jgi:hypothetical protein
MDAAGARALARRIEEQQARNATRDSILPPAPQPVRSDPVTLTPTQGASVAARLDQPPVHEVEIARPRASQPGRRRDIRMYSRTVAYETVDGRPAVVTTVRCRALVDGEWQSRIVEVQVEPVPGQVGRDLWGRAVPGMRAPRV